jgi:DNA-directed RNA polymerases I, II, and III subunit RPABC2
MEQVKENSKILHPEVLPVSREKVAESMKNPRTTLPYFTKYEYVTLLGTREEELGRGARPMVSLDGMITSAPDFLNKLAEKEIHERKLPFIIERRLPDGVSEFWSVSELSVIW